MSSTSREDILKAARRSAQARGYNKLNFRDLAAEVGIRAASIYYHFPSKAALGAAVARRYWEDTAALLETISSDSPDPVRALDMYPDVFRRSLAAGNRICLCSFLAAEHDDLPEAVLREVETFADVNVTWLDRMLVAAGGIGASDSGLRAQTIFAAVAGAQLVARSRSDISVFDALIEGYRSAGLLPSNSKGAAEASRQVELQRD